MSTPSVPVQHITHLELEIADLCLEDNGWAELREGLPLLGELQALGLPTALHVDHLQHAADVLTQLGGILAKLSRLRRLDLASCCLREGLGHLLAGLGEKVGGLEYLGLRDCRLVEHDLSALLQVRGVGMMMVMMRILLIMNKTIIVMMMTMTMVMTIIVIIILILIIMLLLMIMI